MLIPGKNSGNDKYHITKIFSKKLNVVLTLDQHRMFQSIQCAVQLRISLVSSVYVYKQQSKLC